MRRHAYVIALVLLASTTAAWVRTTWYDEYLHYQWEDSAKRWWDVVSLGSASGKLVVGRSRTVVRYTFSDGFNYRRYDRDTRERADRGPMAALLGFQYWPRDYEHETAWLVVPYWFITSLLLVVAYAAWRLRFPSPRRFGGFPVSTPRAPRL